MSLISSTLPDRNHTINKDALTMLSLTEIFKESMKKLQPGYVNKEMIVRCESLPHISGDEARILNLFCNIIGIITEHSSASSKLFLYIDCEEENKNMSAPEEFKRYLIRFHTNIAVNPDWMERNRNELTECEHILMQHNGTFQVNTIKNTGCLFSIVLPGKFA